MERVKLAKLCPTVRAISHTSPVESAKILLRLQSEEAGVSKCVMSLIKVGAAEKITHLFEAASKHLDPRVGKKREKVCNTNSIPAKSTMTVFAPFLPCTTIFSEKTHLPTLLAYQDF
jgi:hypothetical protein